jgi:hypothetical protein
VVAYLLVSQLIVSSAPPLPPAQSARILAQVESPANFSHRFVCTDCGGPYADIIPSRAGDGPFGPFPQYVFAPLGCCSYYYGGYGGYYAGTPWWGEGPYVSRVPFAARQNVWGAKTVDSRTMVPGPSSGGFASGVRASAPPVGARR